VRCRRRHLYYPCRLGHIRTLGKEFSEHRNSFAFAVSPSHPFTRGTARAVGLSFCRVQPEFLVHPNEILKSRLMWWTESVTIYVQLFRLNCRRVKTFHRRSGMSCFNLTTWIVSRTRGDILTSISYQVLFGMVAENFSDIFEFSHVNKTRDHAYRLYRSICDCNGRYNISLLRGSSVSGTPHSLL